MAKNSVEKEFDLKWPIAADEVVAAAAEEAAVILDLAPGRRAEEAAEVHATRHTERAIPSKWKISLPDSAGLI